MKREETLRRRIKLLTWFFIVGLVFSGATAIPLNTELDWLVNQLGGMEPTSGTATSELGRWLLTTHAALQDVSARHPLLFYGTDWLAFGHFVIALAFVGALREPVRNRWLFDFGLMACGLVVPFAIAFGALRGIPFWWRLIDCSFGVVGFMPLWFCRKWAIELERGHR